MTCDVCGRSQKVAVEATCSADHQSNEPQPAPEVEIRPSPLNPTRWKPIFVHGQHGHECSACTEDRRLQLAPKLYAIRERHSAQETADAKEATEEWEAARKARG